MQSFTEIKAVCGKASICTKAHIYTAQTFITHSVYYEMSMNSLFCVEEKHFVRDSRFAYICRVVIMMIKAE